MASLDVASMRAAVLAGRIEWKRHALERMVLRGITRKNVISIVLCGQQIEDYAEDYPLPSALFLGHVGDRPLHVVATYNPSRKMAMIITAYEPNIIRFNRDFKTRKEQ